MSETAGYCHNGRGNRSFSHKPRIVHIFVKMVSQISYTNDSATVASAKTVQTAAALLNDRQKVSPLRVCFDGGIFFALTAKKILTIPQKYGIIIYVA